MPSDKSILKLARLISEKLSSRATVGYRLRGELLIFNRTETTDEIAARLRGKT